MSLQTDLFALLTGLFAAQVYPGVAPDKASTPYVVYTRVSSLEQNTLDTNGGSANAKNTRLQIDVYANTYSAAQSNAAAIKTALSGWAVENTVQSEQDFYEFDTQLHRVMLDVSTWHL